MLIGYEALLRPGHPKIQHPGAMLDVAERLSGIHRLGRTIRKQVADTVAPDANEWLVFVNLHAVDLLDKHLLSPFSPLSKLCSRVVLEITERASLDGMSNIRDRVGELRALGFRIAIDDLGAGHSRMDCFSPVDTDFVKLDMSLVRGIDEHPIKQQLVASVVQLCHEQDVQVIGEGVETLSERNTLVRLGCDLLQGYLLAKPGPPFPGLDGLD
jgi:EAL domain-containing protein (putative c-di-GMP-specific phosphodiesterase class I)